MRFDTDSTIGTKLELNLTAFIDVLFILLLFFMVSTTFSQHYIPMQLPSAKTAAPQPIPSQTTLLEISAIGEIFITQKRQTDKSIHEFLTKSITKQVVIRADQRCPVRFVVHTIDLARSNGITNIVIETEK